MIIFKRLINWYRSKLASFESKDIVMLILAYLAISWLGLYWSGEKELYDINKFIYWIVITASTVGFGDYSPQSMVGQYFTAFFIVPIGLTLFAVIISRVGSFLIFHWQKEVNGMKKYNISNHILVVGWNEERTKNLLDCLLADNQQQTILICSSHEISYPLQDGVLFVKVSSYTSAEDMARACVSTASKIIIDTGHDDKTMTAALYLNSLNESSHTIVYFENEGLSKLLKLHCQNVECMPSLSAEMMAKSAVDPGSSFLHQELVSLQNGMTQYSTVLKLKSSTVRFSHLFQLLKTEYDATIIAVESKSSNGIMVNPSVDLEVCDGDKIFYISDKRIDQITF